MQNGDSQLRGTRRKVEEAEKWEATLSAGGGRSSRPGWLGYRATVQRGHGWAEQK